MADKGRAAVFMGTRKPFEIRDYTIPDPGERDMIIKINRVNVCGSDLHLWRGDTDVTKMGLTYGMILGHELVGTVHKKGKKVFTDALGKNLREGDRVVSTYYVPCGRCRACCRGKHYMCMASVASLMRSCDMPPHFIGGFADYYYWKGKQTTFRVPDAVEDNVAAGANCALAQVLHGYEEARLEFGDTVVVQGAGGLGLYACALAREMGADRIIAIDSVAERLEMAKAFGADEVIDMTQVPDPRARVGLVMGKLDRWGADVVVEVAGVPEAVPEGIRMLARGGRYLELGNINPRATYKADPSLLVGMNRSIIGVSLYPPDVLRRAMDFLKRTKDRYPFHKLLSHDFELADINDAFAFADIGGHDHDETAAADCPRCTRASIVPAF